MGVEDAKLTDAEKSLIATVAEAAAAQDPYANAELAAVAATVRTVARQEIASLCALVLRRLQEERLSRSPEFNLVDDHIRHRMSSIFAEALADFSGHTKGEEPGD